MKPIKNTLTYVDSYGNSHTVYKFSDDTIHEAMKDLINILRYAGFAETSIVDGLDKITLDF